MLKAQEFIYETQDYKILYPNQSLKDSIISKIIECSDSKGEDFLESYELKLFLLQSLVISDIEDYNFNCKTEEDLKDYEENPSFEYETIIYFIGNITSDLLVTIYRAKVLELRNMQIKILRNEAFKITEEINFDLNVLAKKEKRVNDEKRVDKLRKEKGLDLIKSKVDKENR